MENKLYLKILYPKLVNREINEEELQWLLNYFEANQTEDLQQLIREELDLEGENTATIPATAHEKLIGINVYNNLLQQIYNEPVRVRTLRLWPRIVAAAVVLVIIGVGLLYYTKTKPLNNKYAADVAPGSIGATLTLANGKKIKLDETANGELVKEAGIKVSKTANGQLVYEPQNSKETSNNINTLSTAKGETYVVSLPDKSKVWLNAASSLTYTTGLSVRGVRRVKLVGEAFFEVTKDKAHPFIVQTKNQEVTVLGTVFNVNSYADEPATATTLIEGSVRVSAGNRQQIIVPGEQLVNDGTNFKVARVNPDNVTDWKNGEFNLDGLPFQLAMRKIARWYDVEIIYDKSMPNNIISGGWVSRDTRLSTILDGIEKLGMAHFKLEGRKLYVTK